ncbi:MAG: uracil-DNA glycosylase family protein [Chitinophagales bacterium]
MNRSAKERIISKIVKMEERIVKCNRCKEIRTCCKKPSLGRGDVEATVMVVFATENDLTKDRMAAAKMREQLAVMAGNAHTVYHTYMVRCQPKTCARRKGKEFLFDGQMINNDSECMLTNRPCDGKYTQPDDKETMNCLHFLLEEIEILGPEVIITVGEETYQYVFRAFGLITPSQKDFTDVNNQVFRTVDHVFIPVNLDFDENGDAFPALKEVFKTLFQQ